MYNVMASYLDFPDHDQIPGLHLLPLLLAVQSHRGHRSASIRMVPFAYSFLSVYVRMAFLMYL